MNTLFISSYNESIIIGLLKEGLTKDLLEILSAKSHSVNLIPAIKEILNKNKIELKNLNEIIVVNGPGSFTGVRLGVTVAKTLAYTLNIPIKTITSVEALAVSDNNNAKKIVVIDDNKGSYYGTFENNKLIGELSYLISSEFNAFISENEAGILNLNKFDLEKIYFYLENKEGISPHLVKPVYIKQIEVLNGN